MTQTVHVTQEHRERAIAQYSADGPVSIARTCIAYQALVDAGFDVKICLCTRAILRDGRHLVLSEEGRKITRLPTVSWPTVEACSFTVRQATSEEVKSYMLGVGI